MLKSLPIPSKLTLLFCILLFLYLSVLMYFAPSCPEYWFVWIVCNLIDAGIVYYVLHRKDADVYDNVGWEDVPKEA